MNAHLAHYLSGKLERLTSAEKEASLAYDQRALVESSKEDAEFRIADPYQRVLTLDEIRSEIADLKQQLQAL